MVRFEEKLTRKIPRLCKLSKLYFAIDRKINKSSTKEKVAELLVLR